MRYTPLLSPCLAAAAALWLAACSGNFGFDSDPGPGGGDDTVEPTPCNETGEALLFLEENCASSACHSAGGRSPQLDREGIAQLASAEAQAGSAYLVPGDPGASLIYLKMTGEAGGALMPLGISSPHPQAELIKSWIAGGASTTCDELPPTRHPYDPNTLDQAALFACESPDAPRSSPARLRRVERREFTHAAVRPLGVTAGTSTVRENPLDAPSTVPYSSYTDNLSIDSATLDLLTLNLPEAATVWAGYDSGPRLEGYYGDNAWRCLNDEVMDDECRAHFVDSVLTQGTLFRTPSDDERARLRAFLDATLSEQPGSAERHAALLKVTQGAMLMAGARFRSELGDESGALADEELALALGHVLSTHPVGVPFVINDVPSDDPDADDPSLGRLGKIRLAAMDGSIQDPEVRRSLLRHYASGISTQRPDIGNDETDRKTPFRGEYWLAPNIANFFREWLDYETIGFKDTPGATSQWPNDARTDRGYSAIQSATIWDDRFQPTFQEQLDDMIARVVIESDQNGTDVFKDLLTSRTFSVPSTLDIGGTAHVVEGMARVHNLDAVANTREARWVDMPATERMGVLTHPTWLASHGANFEDDASLVHRGKWLRENLFCETLPPLALVMVEAQLIPSDPELPARHRVRQSTEEGPDAITCRGCHDKMNPLGYPFEIYNHAGFLRQEDHGQEPDGSTELFNLPDPALNRSYANTFEFLTALSESGYARRGFIRHAFRYFMGRPETMADGCTLLEMEQALDETGSFFAMLEVLVVSDTFAKRHDSDAGVTQ
ncbi:DUF1588 domain-containing protein [Haliangium ochraceum]|uniref:Cytochrome c domain-containing protein n=1 Tax=Haliangium ochraceum (strain DSM 14365 / JCM 11303 / SMP-2) TaxID=502025 RepID=D0LTC9_HALO1|nr:DUF1588 domain-containing protein [Haliangium ochraceum]ACY13824.1 Protein of unknown function DUF1588 [Haliangium ochraceum DSM 14365]